MLFSSVINEFAVICRTGRVIASCQPKLMQPALTRLRRALPSRCGSRLALPAPLFHAQEDGHKGMVSVSCPPPPQEGLRSSWAPEQPKKPQASPLPSHLGWEEKTSSRRKQSPAAFRKKRLWDYQKWNFGIWGFGTGLCLRQGAWIKTRRIFAIPGCEEKQRMEKQVRVLRVHRRRCILVKDAASEIYLKIERLERRWG